MSMQIPRKIRMCCDYKNQLKPKELVTDWMGRGLAREFFARAVPPRRVGRGSQCTLFWLFINQWKKARAVRSCLPNRRGGRHTPGPSARAPAPFPLPAPLGNRARARGVGGGRGRGESTLTNVTVSPSPAPLVLSRCGRVITNPVLGTSLAAPSEVSTIPTPGPR